MSSLKCYFGTYFPRCFITWEINTNITLHKKSATPVHTLFFIHFIAFYTKLIIIMPANVLGLNNARPSAGTNLSFISKSLSTRMKILRLSKSWPPNTKHMNSESCKSTPCQWMRNSILGPLSRAHGNDIQLDWVPLKITLLQWCCQVNRDWRLAQGQFH